MLLRKNINEYNKINKTCNFKSNIKQLTIIKIFFQTICIEDDFTNLKFINIFLLCIPGTLNVYYQL